MDRQIIFSAPMVRALIDWRKAQTRRMIKLPTKTHRGTPIYENPKMGGWQADTIGGKGSYLDPLLTVPAPERACLWHQTTGTAVLPKYATGDRLWVREACSAIELEDGTDVIRYHADGSDILIKNTMDAADRWSAMSHYGNRRSAVVPSIHMPRWASRLTLTVTDVRVQRLQEISEADAKAEGCGMRIGPAPFNNYRSGFELLWDSLHGPDAWDANPWIAAISFDVKRGNIGEYEVLK